MRTLIRNLVAFGIGMLVVAAVYHNRALFLPAAPCTQPIQYSIGTFDTRFGLSKTAFLNDVAAAAKIWDSPLHRTLFEYSDSGSLKINLIYDYRQSATSQMQTINGVISGDKATYDKLKATYDAQVLSFNQQKASLDSAIAAHDSALTAYNQQVDYWNSKGGAPKNEYATLQNERQQLNAEANAINQREATLNGLAETVNSTANQLNQLAKKLNLNVANYNSIGASTGEEFDEGLYISDSSGQRIDIYQFENNDKLVRVLAHELGHALGLDHVDDPKAIMYRLNQASTETPTAADIDELKTVCHID